MNKSILCVIPARSKSKGIPNKNIREIGNKSLIEIAIRKALNAKGISKVILSTDSDIYAQIGIKNKVHPNRLRPKEVSHDKVTLIKVLQHELKQEAMLNNHFDAVISLQPTNPFIKLQTIQKCIDTFLENPQKCVSIITEINDGHPYVALRLDENNNLPLISPFINPPKNAKLYPRQAREKAFKHAGALYLRPSEIINNFKNHSYGLGDNPIGIKVNQLEGFDINSPIDLEIANFHWERNNEITEP